MTLRRDELGTPGAINAIQELLGWEKMAALVNKTERWVRYWAEPDTDRSPTMTDAIALDAAYVRAGGKFAPLLEAYTARLNLLSNDLPHPADAPTEDLAHTIRECGEAMAASCLAFAPGASPALAREALVEVSQAATAIGVLARRLGRRMEEEIAS